jgi:hypothetical protein
MADRTAISVVAVRQHVEALPGLRAAFADDVTQVRDAVDRKLRETRRLVDEAEAELRRLREEYQREDSSVTRQDVRDAEDHLDRCRDYAEDVTEAAAQAKLRLRALEQDFPRHYDKAQKTCLSALGRYQIYDAIPHERAMPTAGSAASGGIVGSGSGRGRAGINGAQGLPVLPPGMMWVAIDDLDWGSVPDDLQFKKGSMDDIAAMLARFAEEIMPMMRDPRGISRSQLEQLDRLAGRTGSPQGLVFAWECMIGGNEPIVVNAPHHLTGPSFGWTSGRHRALVARQLGWTHLPARVI